MAFANSSNNNRGTYEASEEKIVRKATFLFESTINHVIS